MICNLPIAIRYVKKGRRRAAHLSRRPDESIMVAERSVIETGSERITGDENDRDCAGVVFDSWRELCGGAD